VIIGGLITFATNYLVERQKSKTEEKNRQREEKAKELSLRYRAYIKFLGVDHNKNDYSFDQDLINATSASIMAYGSPKVSSLLARSFPLDNWESIEATKMMIINELILEKGEKLLLSASIKEIILDAHRGLGDDGLGKEKS
jgi:hypothetical protein